MSLMEKHPHEVASALASIRKMMAGEGSSVIPSTDVPNFPTMKVETVIKPQGVTGMKPANQGENDVLVLTQALDADGSVVDVTQMPLPPEQEASGGAEIAQEPVLADPQDVAQAAMEMAGDMPSKGESSGIDGDSSPEPSLAETVSAQVSGTETDPVGMLPGNEATDPYQATTEMPYDNPMEVPGAAPAQPQEQVSASPQPDFQQPTMATVSPFPPQPQPTQAYNPYAAVPPSSMGQPQAAYQPGMPGLTGQYGQPPFSMEAPVQSTAEQISMINEFAHDSLMSSQATKDSLSALAALADLSKRPSSTKPRTVHSDQVGDYRVHDLIKELLRPMLKEWLDANLPSILRFVVTEQVERLLKQQSGN
jgi:cell pole-organizing protein PopZ